MSYFYKIAMAQIDPNGLCNSGCWFCPVAYSPNPEFAKKNMPVDQLESIVKQLHDGKGTFVSENFNFIYTAHYNEVLLYKHFKEMLDIFRKYNFQTMVLTNGVPLTKERTDIIKEYQDVVYGICFNIPSSDPELWGKYTNMNPKIFEKVKSNIAYAIEQLPEMHKNKTMSIQVNGVNQASLIENGGWIKMMENAPEIDLDIVEGDLAKQVKGFRDLFPGLQVYEMASLIDRAGHLDKHNVITNIYAIEKYSKIDENKRVVKCGNGREVGGRPNGWIHVNANGDLFICCNDYDFETIFGNVNEKPIKDIWMSLDHKMAIAKAYKTLCTTCSAAVWA